MAALAGALWLPISLVQAQVPPPAVSPVVALVPVPPPVSPAVPSPVASSAVAPATVSAASSPAASPGASVPAPPPGVPAGNLPSVTIGGPPAAEAKDKPGLRVPSLLFAPEESSSIRRAIAFYTSLTTGQGIEKGDEAAAFLKRLQEASKQTEDLQPLEKYFTYPQFYMASLIYHSPTDWNVRINNQLLSPTARLTADGLRVVNVDPDKVLLEWTPKNMQKVKETWDATPNQTIYVDFAHSHVVFPLRANQTFSSFVMRVLEGKVRPVVIENVSSASSKPTPPKPAPPKPAVVDSGDKDTQKEGLSGLINQYENLQKDKIK